MKLRRLSLIAFGPFRDATLDFGDAKGALHVIYGRNEAGKSTTLRSISGLLFGIPHQTGDAHRHAMSELRIGGLIETGDGKLLDVVRRKGRKGTLLTTDGQPLDDSALAPALAGTTSNLFETMFGLDHAQMRKSAEDLLAGKGEVGESLFAAGAGARDVHALRKRLSAEAERMFTPRGREQSLTKLIADVREARQRVDDTSTDARAYLEQERVLEELRASRRALAEKRAALLTEQARLQRLSDVLPHLAQKADLEAALARLGDVVLLSPEAPEHRRSAVRELGEAERARERVSEEIARLEGRLAELGPPAEIGSLDETVIRDLSDQKGRHKAAERDLPKREGELKAHEGAALRALEAVDPGLKLADIPRLRIGAAREARIQRLAQERRALDAASELLGRERKARDEKRAGILARLRPVREIREDEQLDDLAVPSPETIDRAARDLDAIEAAIAKIDMARVQLTARRHALVRELDELREIGDVPSEADLVRARGDRDALLTGMLGSSEPPRPALERELWAAVRGADEVGDRLRREADRVCKLASLRSELTSLDAERAELDARSAEAATRRAAAQESWSALWSRASVTPGAPAEMRPFAERFLQLVDVEAERARLSAEVAEGRSALEKWEEQWREAISGLPLSPSASVEEAMAVLQATSELLRQVEKIEESRRRVEGIRRDSAVFAREADELRARFLPGESTLTHAQVAERIEALFQQARSDSEERRRIGRELDAHRQELTQLETSERSARDRVSALLRAARAADLPELENAERRSEQARTVEMDLARARSRIVELGEGESVEALIAATSGFDVDAARARRHELSEDIQRVDEELQQLIAGIAAKEAGVDRMRQDGALEAAARLAERVSQLKREGRRYLRARLASAIVDGEIERYRQENQGPILARAAELLARLTLGNYVSLRAGYSGDDDTAVLHCVRPDGTAVSVEALSEGTRDALYMALRLASLERYAAFNEPMPLVLDDVLIQLDDERASAALAVLADVARLTQVLFFTHHARLVELARGSVKPEALRVHEMPG